MNRRFFLIAFAMIGAAGVLAFVLYCEKNVHWDNFRPRFSETLSREGFATIETREYTAQELSSSSMLEIYSYFAQFSSRTGAPIDYPDAVTDCTLTQGRSSRIECLLCYRSDRLRFVAILSPPGEIPAATDLCSALRRQFPGLTIKAISR